MLKFIDGLPDTKLSHKSVEKYKDASADDRTILLA